MILTALMRFSHPGYCGPAVLLKIGVRFPVTFEAHAAVEMDRPAGSGSRQRDCPGIAGPAPMVAPLLVALLAPSYDQRTREVKVTTGGTNSLMTS